MLAELKLVRTPIFHNRVLPFIVFTVFYKHLFGKQNFHSNDTVTAATQTILWQETTTPKPPLHLQVLSHFKFEGGIPAFRYKLRHKSFQYIYTNL